MKLFVVATLLAIAVADRLENTYLPPARAISSGGGAFLNAPRPSAILRPAVIPVSSTGSVYSGAVKGQIGIVRLNSENPGDGTYRFDYETENRITAQEAGQLKNAGTDGEINSVQGQFAYVGDDGATYSISYTADENGFNAQGAHLPIAPPIPAEILESLQKNAADEAAGIVDDGSYRAEHHGSASLSGRISSVGVSNQYLAPRNPIGQAGGYKY